jgi:hypothetical protein
MSQSPEPQQSNTVGNASLILGIFSAVFVFSIGLCGLTGASQKWISLAATPLFVCGVSNAFLGVLGTGLGIAGIFGKGKPRGAAIAGMVLGLMSLCLFFIFMTALRGG